MEILAVIIIIIASTAFLRERSAEDHRSIRILLKEMSEKIEKIET